MMMDNENENPAANQDQPAEAVTPVDKSKKPDTYQVSTRYRCQTKYATKLCILDPTLKLTTESIYDIGGTYSKDTPEFWFYFSTSVCPKRAYLLNLFVCHRELGTFSIGVAHNTDMNHRITCQNKESSLSNDLVWKQFRTHQKDERHHIKTYSFTSKDLKCIQTTCSLIIPMCIKINPKFTLNSDVMKSIKLYYNVYEMIGEQEPHDFILKSSIGTGYPVHKVLVAACSSVLRKQMNEATKSLTVDVTDDQMCLLIQYMYNGKIEAVLTQDGRELLWLCDKFRLKPLTLLAQHMLGKEINVDNAVETAVLAKKYKLTGLLSTVYKFIKHNPKVMNTDGWKSLNDVQLAKELYQYTNMPQSH